MSLLDTVFVDSTAQMTRIVGDPYQAGFKITRSWPEGHAKYADTKITAMNLVKRVTNPKVDKQTYTGVFVASQIQPSEGADRRPSLSQTLTKIKQITDTASLGPSVDGAKAEVLSPFAVRSGTSNYRTRQWQYIDPDDEQETIGLVPTGDTGYTLIDKDFRHQSDRTGLFTCIYKLPVWGNDTGVYTVVNRTNEGGWGENVMSTATGVPVDTAVTQVRNGLGTDSLLSIGYSERGNGEGVLRKTEYSGDSQAHLTAYYTGYNRVGPRRVKTWYGIPASNVAGIITEANAYVGEASDTNFVHRYHTSPIMANGYATIKAEAWIPNGDTSLAIGNGTVIWGDTVTVDWTQYERYKVGANRYEKSRHYIKHRKTFSVPQFAQQWIDDNQGSAYDGKYPMLSAIVEGPDNGYIHRATFVRSDTWSVWTVNNTRA